MNQTCGRAVNKNPHDDQGNTGQQGRELSEAEQPSNRIKTQPQTSEKQKEEAENEDEEIEEDGEGTLTLKSVSTMKSYPSSSKQLALLFLLILGATERKDSSTKSRILPERNTMSWGSSGTFRINRRHIQATPTTYTWTGTSQ